MVTVGVLPMLCTILLGCAGSDRFVVTASLYRTVREAGRGYDALAGDTRLRARAPDLLRAGGSGDDRFLLGAVEEDQGDNWIGPRGTGSWSSVARFQKGPILIRIRERAEEPRVREERWIREIAARLARL